MQGRSSRVEKVVWSPGSAQARLDRPSRIVCGVALLAVLLGSGLSSGVAYGQVAFDAETIDANVAIGYGVVVGDVDGDGRQDLLLADQTDIVWYENPGTRGSTWPRHVIAHQLTPRDNVCLAARDLDGDGRVEVAVGANWNPGETADAMQSGAVFYLVRPADPRQRWNAVSIAPHEPTVHRMHWVEWRPGQFRLCVLPLHGRGNQAGQGEAARLIGYEISHDRPQDAQATVLHKQFHLTHNFDLLPLPTDAGGEELLIGGREGVDRLSNLGVQRLIDAVPERGAGEVRGSVDPSGRLQIGTIEPMHGTEVVVYRQNDNGIWQRTVIDRSLQQGHALAWGDLLGTGTAQLVAGWRNPNDANRVGIRLYVEDTASGSWQTHAIDDNQMACEDLRLADLDADGRLDVIAAGRATNNLVIYWNECPRQ